MKKKVIDTTPEKPETEISFSKEQDFKFVQLDKSIHDNKFETKPTTYFKDAFKRFCKSKSSVAAASILGVLVLMAIFVPIFDQNNASVSVQEMRFLPPKWFNDANGFMDGTGYVEDVVLDPATGLPATGSGSAVYYEDAIQKTADGELDIVEKETTISDTLAENALRYAKGGYLSMAPLTFDEPAYFRTPSLDSNSSGKTFTVTYGADFDKSSVTEENFQIFVEVTEGAEVTQNALTFELNEGTGLYEGNFTVPTSEQTLSTDLAIEVQEGDIWLSSLSIMIDGQEATYSYLDSNDNLATGTYGFTSPSQYLLNNVLSSTSVPTAYRWQATNGSAAIKEAVVTTGSFRYDYYQGVYGEETGYTFNNVDVDTFVERGWIDPGFSYTAALPEGFMGTFEVTDAETQLGFKLTAEGETYCPLRDISAITRVSFTSTDNVTYTITTVIGTRSRYRDFYYHGYIAECSPVSFLFGTDNQGRDYFKLIFSGLLTSLELGALASIINIFVGVVWGSISGYFGGYVDLFMERLTEILGGMPWTVLMTLIVLLLGSNFWTFLLAMCLTGWIGTAATTRAQFYRFKGREYVLAARTLGASDGRLIFRHILPNGIGTIITSAALMIPSVIFSEATISYILPNVLSFQGTSFGVSLSNAQAYIYTYPYLIISGSIIMAIVMICFNLFGNGLRDAFNPSLKGGNE